MSTPSSTSLSQLSTQWSVVFSAHEGAPEQQVEARRKLLETYGPAVRAYLGASVGCPETTEELFQEFAVRVLRGDFHTTTPAKGRFRAYLKTVLYHLIIDYRRRDRRQLSNVDWEIVADSLAQTPQFQSEGERQFLANWQAALIARAQASLQEFERVGGPPLSRVLGLRTTHVDESDQALARRLSDELHRTIEPSTFRRWLHLARQRFTDALVAEVAWTLAKPTAEVLADELEALGMLHQCRRALNRWVVARDAG